MSGHNENKTFYSFLGYLVFFVTIMVIITVAIAVFVAINRASEGNNTIISLVMIVVILALSAICTLIDYLRRKYTIQNPVNKILDATERLAEGDF